MTHSARITSRGQITIPKSIRLHLELKAGDLLVFDTCEHGMLMKKAVLTPVINFRKLTRGLARRLRERGVTREDMAEAVRWARRES